MLTNGLPMAFRMACKPMVGLFDKLHYEIGDEVEAYLLK